MTEQHVAYFGRTKYTTRTSERYQLCRPGKHRAEMRLVDRAFALVPKMHRVLDVPCGGGRVTVHLSQRGYNVSCADLSDAMLAIARKNVTASGFKCPVVQQDVENLTYADREFDTVISFRLFHHFPNPEIRQRAVAELCRVARQYVALSYFSPTSVTSVKRMFGVATTARRSDRHPTLLSEVQAYFARAGFRLVKNYAQLPLFQTLHLAFFERERVNK